MQNDSTGLGNGVTGLWPKLSKAQKAMTPIERLDTGTAEGRKLHENLKTYLNARLNLSEESMTRFYSRWRLNEMKYQAFIDLPNWEKELKALTDKGEPAKLVSVTVPYAFSVLNTIVTYLVHTFCGNTPMFPINATKADFVQSAQFMEQFIQYNAEHTRLIKHLYQFLNDANMYGVGILRNQWTVEKKLRTEWIESSSLGFAGISLGSKTWHKNRKERIVFEGNETCAVDPFMFFPDPRVPMAEVNSQGEFVFWKDYIGKHKLLSLQKAGLFSYIDKCSPLAGDQFSAYAANQSARGLMSGGTQIAGIDTKLNSSSDVYEVTQGTCTIIPAELGLGEEEYPVKYLFTWVNKKQIVQAEPLNYDHDKHPVSVTEPYSMGYGFGQPSIVDYMAPLQDAMSWLINSHMDNVKTMLNNMWLVDPSRVELQDLKQAGPGKLIRLKRAAYGTDVNAAVRQLQVHDVTSSHLNDFGLIMKLADSLAGVNDNLKGLQDSGGRKTATEVRTSAEAGASRLASLATRISSQGIVDYTEQCVLNAQQFLSEDFELHVSGEQGNIKVSPQMLVGDFNYPVHDGTLPMDKIAMVDVWKQIFQTVASDEQMRSQYNVAGIFDYLAKLGGAKNIEQFHLDQQALPPGGADAQLDANMRAMQAGNAVPLNQAGTDLPGMGNTTPGVIPQPGQRLAGGL